MGVESYSCTLLLAWNTVHRVRRCPLLAIVTKVSASRFASPHDPRVDYDARSSERNDRISQELISDHCVPNSFRIAVRVAATSFSSSIAEAL